jgi:Uri superfamily endonuclease
MKGIYCLLINVKKDINPKIGALGKIPFKKGSYVYIGSAQNSIEKRVSRHFSRNKKVRWHIDYLLADSNVNLKKAVYKKANKEQECKTACFFNKFEEPIKGFGCSDCRCYSHLFRLKSLKNLNSLDLKELKWHANGLTAVH